LILDFIGHEIYERRYKEIVKLRNSWKNDLSKSLLLEAYNFIKTNYSNTPDHLKPFLEKFLRYKRISNAGEELNDRLYAGKFENDYAREVAQKELQEVKMMATELKEEIGNQNLTQFESLYLNIEIYLTPYRIILDLSKLVKRYGKFFNKRRKEYLFDLIKRTSKTRFSFSYPLKVPAVIKDPSEENMKPDIISTRFQNIEIENERIFDIAINNSKIVICFETILGKAYVHNLLTLNTDWFEENYLMLDGYASAIYRRFFVIRRNNKFDQLPIRDLVEYFDFLKNSSYPKVIAKAFEEIKNAGLIHDYRFVANGGKFSKGYIEVVKSSK
jgi:hypothetical protein